MLGIGEQRGHRVSALLKAVGNYTIVETFRFRAGFSFRDRSLPSSVRRRRSWRVIIIRSKGEYLGSVEASDRERAEAVAVKLFDLDQDQRSRLLIRERL
jgi:hypothetical protein